MIDGRFFRAALASAVAIFGLPQAAHACIDGNAMRYYFASNPPEITPDIMFVRVTVVSKTMTSVEARLEGRFASLSANGMIHIELPIAPYGSNCVDWGVLEGPVYVVASRALIGDGRASMIAEPIDRRALNASAEEELRRLRRRAHVTYPTLPMDKQ